MAIMAFNYGLDQHIPYAVNYNSINTEFELFYQNIICNISHILKQNYKVLAKNIVKLKYCLNTGKL